METWQLDQQELKLRNSNYLSLPSTAWESSLGEFLAESSYAGAQTSLHIGQCLQEIKPYGDGTVEPD